MGALLDCLAKSKANDSLKKYIIAQADKFEQKGMPREQAEVKALESIKGEVLKEFKSVYKQLKIKTTVKTQEPINVNGLKPMRIAYKKDKQFVKTKEDKFEIEFEEWDKLSKAEKAQYVEVVKPAQVIITWPYKNFNLKNYTNKDGYLDPKKLSPELMKMFGFRIPNQGHNSMSLVEVVGVLPKDKYNDMVIAPADFVAQMGSDFDVDKLYMYQYKLKKEKQGKRSILKRADTVQNDLLDIHKSVLYNPKVFDRVVSPLPNIADEPIGEELKSIFSTPTDNYLNPDYDGNKFLESVDGKTMVGIDALFTTFLTTLQHGNVELATIVKDERGKPKSIPAKFVFKYNKEQHEVYELSTPTDVAGTPKKTNMSAQVSADVDNESKPIIAFINSNPTTASVKNLMTALGVPNDYIFSFLSQPIIREYVNRAKNNKLIGIKEDQTLEDLIGRQKEKSPEFVKTNVFKPLDYGIDLEELKANFTNSKGVSKQDNKANYEALQYVVLEKFKWLRSYGEILTTAATLSNVDSKGVGKSILEVMDKTDRLENLLKTKSILGLESLLNPITIKEKDEEGKERLRNIYTTIPSAAISYGLRTAEGYFKDNSLLPYHALIGVYKNIENIEGKRELNTDRKQEVFNEFKSYLFASMYSDEYRKEIFFGTKDTKSLAAEVLAWKKHPSMQKNVFLQSLALKRKKKIGDPDLITFNAAKKQDVDGQRLYQGFADLWTNDNPKLRTLGRKLVDYFFLAGGVQEANQWGKLISPRYLKAIGLTTKIQALSEQFDSESIPLNEFLDLYYQHKPFRTLELEPANFKKAGFDGNSDIRSVKTILLKGEGSPFKIDALRTEDQVGSERFSYTKYFHIINKEGKPVLFKLVKEQFKEGILESTYEQIETRGSFLYKDYSHNKTAEVINTQEEPKTGFNKPPLVNDNKQLVTGSVLDNIVDVDTQTALKNISETALTTYLARLDFLKNVPITGANLQSNGRFTAAPTGGSIELSTNLKERKSAENTLIHEAIHAGVTAVEYNWVNPTPAQKEALARIKTLRQTIINKVRNGEVEGYTAAELDEFNKLLRESKDKNHADINANGRLRELIRYYPLSDGGQATDWQEFVTALFDSKQSEFRQMLNKIDYDHNVSFLSKLWELITTILNEFKKLYNIDVRKDSALAAAIKDSLAILDKPADNKPGNNPAVDTTVDSIAFVNHSISVDEVEKSVARKYKGFINDLKSRLEFLRNAINNEKLEGNTVKVHQLTEREKVIKEELEQILNKGSYEMIVEIAKKDLEYAEKLINQPNVSGRDLNYIERVLATYIDITSEDYGLISKEALEETTDKGEALEAIQNKAFGLEKKRQRAALRAFANSVNATAGVDGIAEETLGAHKPLNIISAYFQDLSRSGDITLQVIDKWLKEASERARLSYRRIDVEVDQLIKSVLDNNYFKEKGWDLFFQKHTRADGSVILNGRLLERLSDDYYGTREELLKILKSKRPKSAEWVKAFKDYKKWIKENHVFIDVSKLVKVNDDGTYSYNPNATYLEELKKQLGKDYDKLMEEQIDKIKMYNEALSSKILSVADDPDGFRTIEMWIAENSPIAYLQSLDNYQAAKINGKNVYRSGWSYVVRRAIDKWEDNDYKRLLEPDNKALKDFYDYTVKTLYELYGYLPYDLRREFGGKSVPHIMKNLADSFKDEGFAGARNNLFDSIIEGVSTEGEDKAIKGSPVAPESKKIDKRLKMQYLKKLEHDEFTTDLGKILKMFAKEAYTYKYKAKIEDSVRLAHSVLSKSLEYTVNSQGQRVRNVWGKYMDVAQASTYRDRLDYILETFYGERRKTEFSTDKKKFLGVRLMTTKARKAYEQEKKLIEESTNLQEQEKQAALEALKDKYSRNLNWGKVGDSLLQYIQIKAMGWNPFSAINNVLFGWLSNFTYAAGAADVSIEDMLAANKVMLSTVVGIGEAEPEVAKKIRALMIKFDTLKEILDTAYKDSSDSNKSASLLKPLEMQRRGEYFVQGMTLVSMLMHQKVTIDGKQYSLWESFDNEGKWKYANKEQWGEGNVDDDSQNREFIDFKLKLTQTIKKIHGNYDPDSPVMAKKWLLGRALLQFRSWMAEGVASRFEGQKYDLLLKRDVEGRYVTLGKLGFKNAVKTLFKQAVYLNDNKAFEGLGYEGAELELLKENMKRNLMELSQYVSLTALALLLSGFDDDDEDKNPLRNYSLNILYRISDDIEFYSSPIAMQNITRTAIPALTFIVDGAKFVDAVGKAMQGEDIYEAGTNAGQSRLLLRGARLVPFGTAISSNIAKFRATEEFRN